MSTNQDRNLGLWLRNRGCGFLNWVSVSAAETIAPIWCKFLILRYVYYFRDRSRLWSAYRIHRCVDLYVAGIISQYCNDAGRSDRLWASSKKWGCFVRIYSRKPSSKSGVLRGRWFVNVFVWGDAGVKWWVYVTYYFGVEKPQCKTVSGPAHTQKENNQINTQHTELHTHTQNIVEKAASAGGRWDTLVW